MKNGKFAFILLGLLFLLPLAYAQTQTAQPTCQQTGTEQEGWYQNEQMIMNASCADCKSVCDYTGTQQEGWYSSCDKSLIKQEACLIKCYSDANCPPKQSIYCRDSQACTETISQTCENPGTTSSKCVAESSLICADCTYGCSDGRCKTQEIPIPKICTDSDGEDYYTRGYVKTESGDIWDSCSGTQLKEGICINENYDSVSYSCLQGCEDGRCIKKEIWTGLVHIEIVENICEECPASTSAEQGRETLCRCEAIKIYSAKIQLFDSSGNLISSGGTENGYIEFFGLKEGRYSAKLSAEGYVSDHADINVGQNIGNYWTISLKRAETAAGNIKITVQDKATGTVLTGAKVFVYDTSGNFIASGDTSPGSAVIYNLKEGKYIAIASADEYNQNKAEFQIAGGKSDYLTIGLEKQEIPQQILAIYWFRNSYWQCYDGYEGTEGGETSCKPSEVWKNYAEDACKQHCSKETGKCGVNTFRVYTECPGSAVVQPPVCGNGICESGEGEMCEIAAVACEAGKKCEAKTQSARCYYGCEQDCRKADEKDIPARLNEKFKMQMSQQAKFQDIPLKIKFNDLFIPRCAETATVEETTAKTAQLEPAEKSAIVEKYSVTGDVISSTTGSIAAPSAQTASVEQKIPETGTSSASSAGFAIAKCIGAEPYAVLQIKSGQENPQTVVIKLQVGEKRRVFDFTISFLDYEGQGKTGVFLVSKESFECPENCICDLGGKTIECKKIEKCPEKTMLCPDGVCRKTCEVENITIECNFGCFYNGKCLPYGLRTNKLFCSIADEMKSQMAADEACENNFECESNVCVNSRCISAGLLQRILDWFKNLFG